MEDDAKLILWGILIVLLLIIIGIINPFTNTDYICHYLYNGLITLSYKSEINLEISALQNVF